LVASPAPEPLFVPAVVTAALQEPTPTRPARPRKRKTPGSTGIIELEIDGIAMRVGRGADARTVTAVIRALKATS
jgi:transposase